MANLKKFKEFTKYLDVKGDIDGNDPGEKEHDHTPDVDEHIYWYDLKYGKVVEERAIVMGEISGSLWFYFYCKSNVGRGEKIIRAAKKAFSGVTITRTKHSAYIRIGDISKCDIEKTSEKIKELLEK
ncbi:MAG: hypothetical protein VZQ47_11975 [Treponema sp.]|nr:hypothetical protein [Treponema sp.]MEE3436261.1 hypothetical protein [Treponema sp.]